MNKLNLLKTLILVTAVLTGTVKAYGYAETVQTLSLSVPDSVSIEKTVSTETGTINPENGTHTGLNASFSLVTNNSDYDFVVASKITTASGEASAYTDNGELIFANATVLPTITAVNNIKNGTSSPKDNSNVIAYPVTITATDGEMTINYDSALATNEGEGAYKVSITTGTEGTILQTVGTTPVQNTYSVGSDVAGSYQCTVYITAVAK